ncbi:MAG: polymerase, partial [Gammaproteobacteria bacterium]
MYRDPQNIGLLCLWLLIHLANLFAIYPPVPVGISVELVLSTLNTLMVVYFSSILCVNTEKELRFLSLAILISVIFYTYWANMSYLTGEMWARTTTGRLTGPPGSMYQDENGFALLFV